MRLPNETAAPNRRRRFTFPAWLRFDHWFRAQRPLPAAVGEPGMKRNHIALGLWTIGAGLLVLNLVGVVSTLIAWSGFPVMGAGGALA